MPVSVKGFDGNPFDQRSIISGFARVITTLVKLVLSGSYTTGGDTLDWTNGGVNSAVPSAQSFQTTGPVRCDICDNGPTAGILANGGNYVCIPGTLVTNWLLKVFKTAGSEYGASAYLADALTDTILVRCDWAR
jgi:hypothetical protein